MSINKTSELDKSQIYTLVGYYSGHTFTDLENNEYTCLTYRIVNENIEDNRLCAVNIKWSESLGDWLIFQFVLFQEDVVPHQSDASVDDDVKSTAPKVSNTL